MSGLQPNQGKNEVIDVNGVRYSRLPVKTSVITENDSIAQIAEKYVSPHLEEGDVVFISEKSVACSQKRAIPLKDIHPGRLARILSRLYTNPLRHRAFHA
jgi:F420-0:gamma-glutamyl ligase